MSLFKELLPVGFPNESNDYSKKIKYCKLVMIVLYNWQESSSTSAWMTLCKLARVDEPERKVVKGNTGNEK
ncbi:hypothetical protein RO3G_11132 [Rhizopus delemar RA 99-880]|uniref:Uncharacterized protein n=1 Tax=Rhizopus delemar (strain RA 99-880 / ATCC MYA-4621 / FGSC 9543 / NRRL 43880) TaxID=246409 RepID=I1CD91_RHIO9|nr:hypothetical protein RO3G_11132 [Rhizopus delemar RA 99-880]|eukprot:EIE86421.1 hypothetical protein RO3G_11132 [Rhizopus delemar RA 99-880]